MKELNNQFLGPNLHGVGEVEEKDDLVLCNVVNLKLWVECQHACLVREGGRRGREGGVTWRQTTRYDSLT